MPRNQNLRVVNASNVSPLGTSERQRVRLTRAATAFIAHKQTVFQTLVQEENFVLQRRGSRTMLRPLSHPHFILLSTERAGMPLSLDI